MHGSDGISGDISKAWLLLSVSWSLLWHKDCVLLCPTLPLLLPHKPRDVLALCSVQKLFRALLGFRLSCGSCFSSNPLTKDTAALRQGSQKRHDIFYSSRTINLHFWHILMCWTSWYKLSDSHCTLQYPYFKNCSVNHCNLRIRALNWIQDTQFWSASVVLSNCRWDTLMFLASFLSLCRTLIAILICKTISWTDEKSYKSEVLLLSEWSFNFYISECLH